MWISDNLTSLAIEGEVTKEELISIMEYNTSSLLDQIIYLKHAIVNSAKSLNLSEQETTQIN